jgi:hypothetical protein
VDFSWLGKVFKKFKDQFGPLKAFKTWKIWSEIKNAYERWKRWRDWYKKNVQTYIDSIKKLQRQIYNTFFLPVLKVIDTLRRMSQIVGIISPKLAAKLNSVFFRIEGAILAPLRVWQNRINGMNRIMQQVLTPLGYLDRATLLTSLWRDAKYLRVIARNPLAGTFPKSALPPGPTVAEQAQSVKDYLNGHPTDISADVDAGVEQFRRILTGGAE